MPKKLGTTALHGLATTGPCDLISHYSPPHWAPGTLTSWLCLDLLTSGTLHLLFIVSRSALLPDKNMIYSLMFSGLCLMCLLLRLSLTTQFKIVTPLLLTTEWYTLSFFYYLFSHVTYHFWHTLSRAYFIHYCLCFLLECKFLRAGMFIWFFMCSVNLCLINE